jgi:hypothetical protein
MLLMNKSNANGIGTPYVQQDVEACVIAVVGQLSIS